MALTKPLFLSILRKKNLQIAERDRRITRLMDEITRLTAQEGSCGTAALGGDSGSCDGLAVRLGRPLPSHIMRRMDRKMAARWQQKLRPVKSAEQKRDEVMNELDETHAQAIRDTIQLDNEPDPRQPGRAISQCKDQTGPPTENKD